MKWRIPRKLRLLFRRRIKNVKHFRLVLPAGNLAIYHVLLFKTRKDMRRAGKRMKIPVRGGYIAFVWPDVKRSPKVLRLGYAFFSLEDLNFPNIYHEAIHMFFHMIQNYELITCFRAMFVEWNCHNLNRNGLRKKKWYQFFSIKENATYEEYLVDLLQQILSQTAQLLAEDVLEALKINKDK